MKNFLCLLVCLFAFNFAYSKPIRVISAENQYGSVAKLIGGDKVDVTSIIENASSDPHSFVATTKNARLVYDAQVVIYNGADYDVWIDPLINNAHDSTKIIEIAKLKTFQKDKFGINPHLWYDPTVFPLLATKLTAEFSKIDPQNKEYFEKKLVEFEGRYQKVYAVINKLNKIYKGTPVTATEPLFGYMADSIGLKMMGLKFQWTIMNDAEPNPKTVISYNDLFTTNSVDVVFYNYQVSDNVTENILTLADKNNVSIVGLTETMPTDVDAISWIFGTLIQTQRALER